MFRFTLLFCVALVLSVFPFSAFADMSGTVTLQAGSTNNSYSFDAGATPGCAGDISYSYSSATVLGVSLGGVISAWGTAAIYAVPGAGGSEEYSSLTEPILQQLAYTSTGITNVVADTVFAVYTNGGHYAKVLVTAVSSTSITLQFVTYEVTAGAPVILSVRNNYSAEGSGEGLVWGIAPGTLFVVSGCGLAAPGSAATLQDPTHGLPLTLNGASLSMQFAGVTAQPALYYASPTQIAAVLPSSAPIGTWTITATYNQLSSSAPIGILPSAFGFDTYYGTGAGMAVATDVNYQLLTYTNAAQPGQTIVFWGSGLGAGAADSDTTYTPTPHPISVSGYPLHVLIGGIEASIVYQGRSPYPGLDQINVTVPQGVPLGCAVSVVAGNGDYYPVSNFVTLPISASGGACNDPLMGISAAQIASLSAKPTVNVGVLTIDQSSGDFSGSASANFFAIPGASLAAWAAQQYANAADVAFSPGAGMLLSLGSCVVNTYPYPAVAPPMPWYTLSSSLDAGSMTITGPTGTQALPQQSGPPPSYGAALNLPFPMTGGAFTFAALGGKDVGAFSATLDFPTQETFPGMSQSLSPLTVNYLGQTFTWTGGTADSYITFLGSNNNNATFVCNAPAAAGTFTIPEAVWKAMFGASNGYVRAQINAFPEPFSATGLDAGYVVGSVTPAFVGIVYP